MAKRILTILAFVVCAFAAHAQTLMLKGGRNYEEFLGYLNASEYNSSSIWNEVGTYGNEFSSKSIWNEFGTYGSEFSQYSPFNESASYPPAIVDSNGNFYGYLTVNKYKSNRADFELAEIICKYYKYIREDVTDWYNKIFE